MDTAGTGVSIVFTAENVVVNNLAIVSNAFTVISMLAGNLTMKLGGGASAIVPPVQIAPIPQVPLPLPAFYVNIGAAANGAFPINLGGSSGSINFNSNGVFVSSFFADISTGGNTNHILRTNVLTSTTTNNGFTNFVITNRSNVNTSMVVIATDIHCQTEFLRSDAIYTNITFGSLTMYNPAYTGGQFGIEGVFDLESGGHSYVTGDAINVTQSPTSAGVVFLIGSGDSSNHNSNISVNNITTTTPFLNGNTFVPGQAMGAVQINFQNLNIISTSATTLPTLINFISKSDSPAGAGEATISMRGNRLVFSAPNTNIPYLFGATTSQGQNFKEIG